jgi:hypothetical protein
MKIAYINPPSAFVTHGCRAKGAEVVGCGVVSAWDLRRSYGDEAVGGATDAVVGSEAR